MNTAANSQELKNSGNHSNNGENSGGGLQSARDAVQRAGRMASILSQHASSAVGSAFDEQVSRTAGGKLAASIRNSVNQARGTDAYYERMQNSFGSDNLSNSAEKNQTFSDEDLQAEIDNFVNGNANKE